MAKQVLNGMQIVRNIFSHHMGTTLITLLLFTACLPPTQSALEHGELLINFNDSTQQIVASTFQKRKVEGCFILYDLAKDSSLTYNDDRLHEAFSPASTFKIANSLIALECRAVKNVHEIIPWDSVERFIPAWNTDQTMQTALRYSAVWVYQELARRIGQERMQKWVKKLNYGNKKVGPKVDDFWLVGDLRITPMEQVDFLKRLIDESLPVKKKYMNAVKEIMIEAQTDYYIFRGKTGWADSGKSIGWYVGWLETGGKNYIFVINIDIVHEGDQKYRKEITKEILDEIFKIDLDI